MSTKAFSLTIDDLQVESFVLVEPSSALYADEATTEPCVKEAVLSVKYDRSCSCGFCVTPPLL
jgi:hypothetical protein